MRRGSLHWARLDKRRPVLVISPDYRNELAADCIVVPCSTVLRPAPTHVSLGRGEGGLPEASVVKCEQVMTLRRSDIDAEALGPVLSAARIEAVERALLRALGIGSVALRRLYLASLAERPERDDPGQPHSA